jgi:hypothetical protein
LAIHDPNKPSVTSLDWQPPKSHKRAGSVNRRTPSTRLGRECRVTNCVDQVSTNHGVYCNRHQMAFRRHGDPRQTGVEVRELASYLRAARRVIERNRERVNWSTIYEGWDATVQVCHAIEAEVRTGKPYVRWRRQAANLVTEVAENVEASRLFELVAAMYLFAEMRPEKFVTDTSFAAEVLHVVRREAKAGRRFTVGYKSSVSYRLLSGRVRDTAARFIIDALGLAALAIARAETRRIDALAVKANEKHREMAAIE